MSEARALATKTGLWATFTLVDEMFAVHAGDVQEVITDHPLTPVPLAPAYIRGLINLRGQIVPAIDLRRRLHFPERPALEAWSMLVLTTQDGWLGVVVDTIGDVLTLPDDDWQAPPDTLTTAQRRMVSRICPIPGHMVMALNVVALATDDQDAGAP